MMQWSALSMFSSLCREIILFILWRLYSLAKNVGRYCVVKGHSVFQDDETSSEMVCLCGRILYMDFFMPFYSHIAACCLRWECVLILYLMVTQGLRATWRRANGFLESLSARSKASDFVDFGSLVFGFGLIQAGTKFGVTLVPLMSPSKGKRVSKAWVDIC
jgi:hypothetical protein